MQEVPLLLAAHGAGRLQGQARLAHAACTYQGNQPAGRVRQQRGQFGQLFGPPDKGGCGRGEGIGWQLRNRGQLGA